MSGRALRAQTALSPANGLGGTGVGWPGGRAAGAQQEMVESSQKLREDEATERESHCPLLPHHQALGLLATRRTAAALAARRRSAAASAAGFANSTRGSHVAQRESREQRGIGRLPSCSST